MHVELLDDCRLPWQGVNPFATPPVPDDNLDLWFWHWAQARLHSRVDPLPGEGLFLINAHGRFARGAHRQDLQGVEVLKHIRLTPWLGSARGWHAIVYSLEPLDDILSRKPGDLVLKSRGVTFLRLPSALQLRNALINVYPRKKWASLNLMEILSDLARNDSAAPNERSFRPYVASDYTPPDSAHETSNLWGLYEMWPTSLAQKFPEVDAPGDLPTDVLAFVLSLNSKKARWLEGERTRHADTTTKKTMELLRTACKDKRIIFVDDEAERGWAQFLRLLLNQPGADGANCILWTPDPATLVGLRRALTSKDRHAALIKELAAQIREQKPDLVILDLRLCGSAEFTAPPAQSSGMELARVLRASELFLPILLFTASNKAETLQISHSHNIDEYWMKPGLGEHRGLGSREADITSLANKIEYLVGADYAWLQRMALDLSAINAAAPDTWWWERSIKWPNPARNDRRPISKLADPIRQAIMSQPARVDVRIAVVELLLPMIDAFRISLRLERRDSNEAEPPTPELLRAGIFNQLGKLVELIHGFTDGSGIPEEFQSAGTVGGRKDTEDNAFVFFRRDWCAFRFFAQRNEWSHVRMIDQNNPFAVIVSKKVSGPSKENTVAAMSDAMAWLTVPRVDAVPQEVIGRDDQRFQLSLGDWLPAGQRDWTRLTSRAAAARAFRECMSRRPEYEPLIAKADDLKKSYRKATKH